MNAKMKPVSLGQFYDGDTNLLCPWCNSNHLHHGGVTVYGRTEDAVVTSRTIVVDGNARTHRLPSKSTDNPSSRRQGLAVRFRCEQCDLESELTIAQHKGVEVVGWRAAQ